MFFDFNKSDLTSQAQQIVDQAASNAGPAHVTRMVVTGHTDTVGSDDDNDRLSNDRANEILNALIAAGLPREVLTAVGRGERDLLVPTADGVANAANRRVEVIVR